MSKIHTIKISEELGHITMIERVENCIPTITVEYINTRMEFPSWTEAKAAASVIAMFSQQIHDATTMKAHIDKVKYHKYRGSVNTAITGRVVFGDVNF